MIWSWIEAAIPAKVNLLQGYPYFYGRSFRLQSKTYGITQASCLLADHGLFCLSRLKSLSTFLLCIFAMSYRTDNIQGEEQFQKDSSHFWIPIFFNPSPVFLHYLVYSLIHWRFQERLVLFLRLSSVGRLVLFTKSAITRSRSPQATF